LADEEKQRVDQLLAQFAARVAARVAFQALYHILNSKDVIRPPTPERVAATQKRISGLKAVKAALDIITDQAWEIFLERDVSTFCIQMAWRSSVARGRRAARHASAMLLSFTLNSIASWQAARKRFADRGMFNEPLYRRCVLVL
jgi:hypothetical protein